MALTDKLVAIADQVRRISGVTDELTLEQMETNLLNVTVGADLTNAEDSGFGNDPNGEHGIVVEGSAGTTADKNMTLGYVFTAAEAFSIVGLRYKQSRTSTLKLWDSSGNAVKTISAAGVSDWEILEFDTPLNVAIGETYTVTVYCTQPKVLSKSSTTFNSKLTGVAIRYSIREDIFPTTDGGGSNVACVDIVIAPVDAERPNSYKIQRSTMDDIAEEVQRITGATDKLTTTQIIDALQDVEAGGGSSEVVSLIVEKELAFGSNGHQILLTQQEIMDAGLVPNLESPLHSVWKHFRIEAYLDEGEWETAYNPVIRSCIVDNYGGRYSSDIGIATVTYRKAGNDYNTTDSATTVSVGSSSNGQMTISQNGDLTCYVGTYYKYNGNYTISIICWGKN